jgi:hypothetical protein
MLNEIYRHKTQGCVGPNDANQQSEKLVDDLLRSVNRAE